METDYFYYLDDMLEEDSLGTIADELYKLRKLALAYGIDGLIESWNPDDED